MALKIKKGNTLQVRVAITMNGEEYTLSPDDIVYFTVKKNCTATAPVIIEKVITAADYVDDQLVMTLSAVETDIPTGVYQYDFSLVQSGDNRYTIIGPDTLIIEPVVTNWGDNDD